VAAAPGGRTKERPVHVVEQLRRVVLVGEHEVEVAGFELRVAGVGVKREAEGAVGFFRLETHAVERLEAGGPVFGRRQMPPLDGQFLERLLQHREHAQGVEEARGPRVERFGRVEEVVEAERLLVEQQQVSGSKFGLERPRHALGGGELRGDHVADRAQDRLGRQRARRIARIGDERLAPPHVVDALEGDAVRVRPPEAVGIREHAPGETAVGLAGAKLARDGVEVVAIGHREGHRLAEHVHEHGDGQAAERVGVGQERGGGKQAREVAQRPVERLGRLRIEQVPLDGLAQHAQVIAVVHVKLERHLAPAARPRGVAPGPLEERFRLFDLRVEAVAQVLENRVFRAPGWIQPHPDELRAFGLEACERLLGGPHGLILGNRLGVDGAVDAVVAVEHVEEGGEKVAQDAAFVVGVFGQEGAHGHPLHLPRRGVPPLVRLEAEGEAAAGNTVLLGGHDDVHVLVLRQGEGGAPEPARLSVAERGRLVEVPA
jgi:hypothetical protein